MDARNDYGSTPFLTAASCCNVFAMEALAATGQCDLTAVTPAPYHSNALLLCCGHKPLTSSMEQAITWLLTHTSIDVNASDSFGHTPVS